MKVTLKIKPGREVQKPAVAWFIGGNSVERWLEELVESGMAEAETRLYLVPCSLSNRKCAGLLVIPPSGQRIRHSPAGLACQVRAERFYLPLDAEIHPPVADRELRSLCPWPVAFYHPIHGLSGFDPDSELRVWDLLKSPEESVDSWNHARSGQLLPGLAAVILADPPGLDQVYGDAGQDIGQKPLEELPPAPNEPTDHMWSRISRGIRGGIPRLLHNVLKHLPHIAPYRTWVNDMEDWALKKYQAVGDELNKLRNREVDRLLHMLKNDPEQGLKHAIPMNDFGHRSQAPPGGRLSPRSTVFDPNNLGGQAADFWEIDIQQHELLHQRYREMADREMHLGRYRRAAYIYGELLGDLLGAASALKQGGLFREAALLYDHHLKNPREAARCLAEGGLWHEALIKYEALESWMDVADLWEKLGNQAEADKALRKEVDKFMAQDDVIGAAKLVETRLRDPDEAEQILRNAWPDSRQAGVAMDALFQLWAKRGRHEATLNQLQKFSRDQIPERLMPTVLVALGHVVQRYPHEPAQHRASDLSRILIARQLQRPFLADQVLKETVECLKRLAPEDRLLRRDGNRYVSQRLQAERVVRPAAKPSAPTSEPRVIREFNLPRQMEWMQLKREGVCFYALGATNKRLTLIRGYWDEEIQSLSWPCSAVSARQGLIFEPTLENGGAVALAVLSRPPLVMQQFPSLGLGLRGECKAGTPSWLAPQQYPFAFGVDVVWSAYLAAGQVVLSCYDKVGRLLRTVDVTRALLEGASRGPKTRLSLTVLQRSVVVALGNRLVFVDGTHEMHRVDLPGQVTGLVPTLPHTRQGVAVMQDEGAVLVWVGEDHYQELDPDISSPKGVFLPGSGLVLVSRVNGRIINLDHPSRIQASSFVSAVTGGMVGVCSTAVRGQFAVLSGTGRMTMYGI